MRKIIFYLAKFFIRLIDYCRAVAESKPNLGPNVEIGRHTYGIGAKTIHLANSTNPPKVRVGNFCSIASGVLIIANADHPKYFVSTYPFRPLLFTGIKAWKASGYMDPYVVSRGSVEIGHDVWIGANTVILSGVTIGTGAIIGAGSVVPRDIPSYAIAVGNPARVVSYRFPPEIIEKLLASYWWDLPDEVLRALEPFLYDDDIDVFIDQIHAARFMAHLDI